MTRPHYLLLLALAIAPIAQANDFPTRARVEFVLDCMRSSKAQPQESMYKCSCAICDIAAKVDYATWVDLSTIANATTIAGERGGVMRDTGLLARHGVRAIGDGVRAPVAEEAA